MQEQGQAAETEAQQEAHAGQGSDLEADLEALCTLGRILLQGLLQHSLEGLTLAVGVVAQEAENGVEIVHTVLDGGPAQAPPPARLHFHCTYLSAIVGK